MAKRMLVNITPVCTDGKSPGAYATLLTENCADYESVKVAIFKSFELVPEAYRQKFRNAGKERKPILCGISAGQGECTL